MKDGFKHAFDDVMKMEGGYSNHPSDRGGETYMGVSRVNWPGWVGWAVVDFHKKSTSNHSALNKLLKADTTVQNQVKDFYKMHFWDRVKGDHLPNPIAQELFDTAVNMGVGRAVQFLQESLNVMNLNGKLWGELAVDGQFGNLSLNAIKRALKYKGEKFGTEVLLTWLNVCQGAFYMRIMKRRSDQEVFAWGWSRRVKIKK